MGSYSKGQRRRHKRNKRLQHKRSRATRQKGNGKLATRVRTRRYRGGKVS